MLNEVYFIEVSVSVPVPDLEDKDDIIVFENAIEDFWSSYGENVEVKVIYDNYNNYNNYATVKAYDKSYALVWERDNHDCDYALTYVKNH